MDNYAKNGGATMRLFLTFGRLVVIDLELTLFAVTEPVAHSLGIMPVHLASVDEDLVTKPGDDDGPPGLDL